MKKQLLLIVGMLFVGIMALLLPYLIQRHNDKVAADKQVSVNKITEVIKTNSSSKKTITQAEVPFDQLEPGIYDKDQLYFEGIEPLYDYFKINQVEQIKQKAQFYLHSYVSKDIKRCKLVDGSIKADKQDISFKFFIEGFKDLDINVKILGSNYMLDISIKQSVS